MVWRRLDVRAGWLPADYLLAAAVDALNLLVWSKTKAAVQGTGRPRPIRRPGEQPERLTAADKAEIDATLARPRRAATMQEIASIH